MARRPKMVWRIDALGGDRAEHVVLREATLAGALRAAKELADRMFDGEQYPTLLINAYRSVKQYCDSLEIKIVLLQTLDYTDKTVEEALKEDPLCREYYYPEEGGGQ